MSVAAGTAAGLVVLAVTGALGRAGAPLRWNLRKPADDAGAVASRGRRRTRVVDELVMAEWCEHAARSLRGGASLTRAIADASAAVPSAAPAFGSVLHALGRGRGLAAALGSLQPDPSRPLGLVVPVLQACAELGGPAAQPLERTALVLHGRAAEAAERRMASTQARFSARVLTLLPAGTLAALTVAEDSTRAALATPAGLSCVALGGACNIAGWWWMRRIILRAG